MKKRIFAATAALALTASLAAPVPAAAARRAVRNARNYAGCYYVDKNGDGICDNFVDADNDGICDNSRGAGRGMGRGRYANAGRGCRGCYRY